MEIIARGVVFAGEKGTDHQSCAFASIAALPSGRWLCGFRAAPTKGATTGQHALITWSDDEGRSWSLPAGGGPRPFAPPLDLARDGPPPVGRGGPELVEGPPPIDGTPGLFRAAYLTALGGARTLAALLWVDHSDPSLPFFNEKTEGLLDTRIFFSQSADGGATWSAPVLMDTSPFNVPTPLTGPVLALPNGEWACQFELNKHYFDLAVWRHSSVLMFSRDEGKSWPEHAIVSNDPENRIFYWDQRAAVLADGSILDLFWTYDNKAAVYLNIHARRSTDNGRTWSEIWDTGVPGQPAAPVSLRDGRIAMVYVDRTGAPAIKLRSSPDRGRTWPQSSEMTLYQAQLAAQTERKGSMQDAWSEMSKFSVGLPATTALANGDLLAVYYAGAETDHTSIEWVRVRAG